MSLAHTVDFSYTGQIQSYTITTSGTYQIYLAGAQGGNSNQFAGGKGASVTGKIHLDAGTVLEVVVAGAGGDQYGAGGGGGGSFVYYTTNSLPVVIAAAGGGGGASNSVAGVAGQVTEWGTSGTAPVITSSTTYGSGAGGADAMGGGGGAWISGIYGPFTGGGGGAGFFGAGADSPVIYSYSPDGYGGRGFNNLSSAFNGGDFGGGFGGGGGLGGYNSAAAVGGGGGGYSGGGGGGGDDLVAATYGGGGGGGSYLISSATNRVLQSGVQSGNGSVWLNLIPENQSSNTINIAGQQCNIQNMLLNNHLINQSNTLTTSNICNGTGGVVQNNPINTQTTCTITSSLMAVKTQKILGLVGAVTAEVAQSMASSVSNYSANNITAGVEAIPQQLGSDVAMQSHTTQGQSGYNYFFLNDFQQNSRFGVSCESASLDQVNFLSIVNNKWTTQTVDLTGYEGIVVVNGGVNVTGLTTHNHLGALGGGTYTFGAGNQTMYMMGPNGVVNGGAGVDTVNMLGVRKSAASITQSGKDVKIWADWQDTGSGVTTLHNVARVQFDDVTVAYDTGIGQNAGSVFRLYEAAFHREADQAGMGYWINKIDNGTALETIANQFLDSQEFINLYGSNPNAGQYVNALYSNVLGRAADTAGSAYWQGQLQSGMSKAQLLVQFAESAEGVAHMAQLVANGVQYTPWSVLH